ncbi:hypothetical protein AAFC00_000599 [Neodothiora populina]|uniref:UBA domain-containing protein n=1 Tax=Neodothiora populina TaxID=2781224 RepID=A0ABR3PDU0_9PEZI
MDDLLGQDWSGTTSQNSSQPQLRPQSNNPFANGASSGHAGLRPSPVPSLNSTANSRPTSRPSGALNHPAQGPSKPVTPANDSFASLLGKNAAAKGPGNLTLQERQRQLVEEKRRQEAEQRQRYANQFGAGDVWDSLGSGRGTPVSGRGTPAAAPSRTQESEEDILAAFSSAVPVDKSSHFPPPTSRPTSSARGTPTAPAGRGFQQPNAPPASSSLAANQNDDDDDPFGLNTLPRNNAPSTQTPATMDDDDDILGDLAKPITAKPPPGKSTDDSSVVMEEGSARAPSPAAASPLDASVAELVDMGFPADASRIALLETDGNVQAAVGFLLKQAHEESKQKTQASRRGTPSHNGHVAEGHAPEARASSQRRGRETESMPAWMRQEGRASSGPRRGDTTSPSHEKDVAQYASEIGTSLFKSANSLWKQGRKQVQKAVQEFNTDHDPSQPKWMRDASTESDQRTTSQSRQPPAEARRHTPQAPDLTDEALMLDSSEERPRKPARTTKPPDFPQEVRAQSPAQSAHVRPSSTSRPVQQQAVSPYWAQDKRPASKLSRQDVEAQSEQAYVSPARRKRPTKPEAQAQAQAPLPQPEPEVDLFSPAPVQNTAARPTQPTSARSSPAPRPSAATKTLPTRPKAPPRSIPAISPAALSDSSSHRQAGTEAFKRGDFDAAHTSYTAALTPLPATHPLVIVVLSNRALTAIKTGDPKLAIADADRVLEVIGPGNGQGEKISLGASEGGEKDMSDYYGKALMRKAEALEHMEKWADAANVYKTCVAAGIGGAVSIRARDRCEKAANPSAAAAAANNPPTSVASSAPKSLAAKPAPKPAGRSVAPSRLALPSVQSASAVRKLREANAAAEKADDEKFALNDQVDATLAAWKGTKADNLRALLGSLDAVLWPEAGWKKVGMSDLVMPNKVKIVYMKAIAKVHPDKIPQNASTEQRMISGAVFSTLNEAWDKFKKDNGL